MSNNNNNQFGRNSVPNAARIGANQNTLDQLMQSQRNHTEAINSIASSNSRSPMRNTMTANRDRALNTISARNENSGRSHARDSVSPSGMGIDPLNMMQNIANYRTSQI